jgi:site-specific recombinase XerD
LAGPVTDWSAYGLVFTTANGHPVEPRNLAHSFERITRAAKLRPIGLHDLRHVTASLLKKLGVPPRDAMVILGHSRISVTLEIYTHVYEESRRDAVGKLDRLLTRVQPSDGTTPRSSSSA